MPNNTEKPERFRFQYGPRDNGPANPPPWWQLLITGIALVVAFTAFGIGVSYEWIGGVYVKGPCAFLFIIGLMFPICFAADGFDKARERGEHDEEQ